MSSNYSPINWDLAMVLRFFHAIQIELSVKAVNCDLTWPSALISKPRMICCPSAKTPATHVDARLRTVQTLVAGGCTTRVAILDPCNTLLERKCSALQLFDCVPHWRRILYQLASKPFSITAKCWVSPTKTIRRVFKLQAQLNAASFTLNTKTYSISRITVR